MGRTSSMEEIAIASMAGGFERRKRPRFECEGDADVVSIDSRRLYHGAMKDFSLTGCCILTKQDLALSRHSDVELSLSINGEPLHTPARVIVVRPHSGAAFEFLPEDPEMRAAILDLIEKLSGESPMLRLKAAC